MNRISRTALLSVYLYASAKAQTLGMSHWQPSASMGSARTDTCSALLADGRVLIAGGTGFQGDLASAEFLGSGGRFATAPSMLAARSRYTCVTLQDGRVLAAGGTSAEIYDPATNAWQSAGEMMEARTEHTATLLADGNVLIVGGESSAGISSSMEIFNPVTNTFSPVTTKLSGPRKQHTAALLPDGSVLIAGGFDGSSALDSTDIFDPRSGEITAGARLSTPRAGHTATPLPDGTILVAGGSTEASAEIFDPAVMGFSTPQRMNTARSGHLALLLPENNNVLLVGGRSANSSPLASAEIYTPWTGTFSPAGDLTTPRAGAIGATPRPPGLAVISGGGNTTSEAFHFPTIQTDKGSYLPDEVVTASGRGWQPREVVRLTLRDLEITAIADGAGNISGQQFPVGGQTAGIRLHLNATGRTWQAEVSPALSLITTTALSLQTNPTVYGQTATFVASVTSVAGNPTGGVKFFDGGNQLGQVNLFLGKATFITTNTALTAGTHIITATYQGDSNFAASTSTPLNQTVNKADSTFSLTSLHNPSTYGDSSTKPTCFSISLRAVNSNAGTPTAGSWTISEGGTVIPSGQIYSLSGTPDVTCLTIPVGTHTIVFQYNGDTNFTFSRTDISQTVSKGNAGTAFQSVSPVSSVYGQPVTFNVVVTDDLTTGTVSIGSASGPSLQLGPKTIGYAGLYNGDRVNGASITSSTIAAGSYAVLASYSGDANFLPTSLSSVVGSSTFTVSKADTSTFINGGLNLNGTLLSISASVLPNAPGAGVPTGTMKFIPDSGPSITATLTNGTASSTSVIVPGIHTYQAVYSGDNNFNESTSLSFSGAAPHVPVNVTLVISPVAPTVGQPSSAVATVTIPPGPIFGLDPPSGTITFVVDGFLEVPVTMSAGKATYSLANLGAGDRTLAAKYSGDNVYSAATTVPLAVTIDKAFASAVDVTATPNPATLFGPLTVAGRLNFASPAFPAYGPVQLVVDGQQVATSTAGVIDGSFSFALSNIDFEPPGGPHSFKIVYLGNGNYLSFTSIAFPLNIAKAATSISLDASPATAVFGQPVTLRASLSAKGPLSGSTQFSDGSNVLLTIASIAADNTVPATISSFAVGTRSLKATYAGDALHTGSTSPAVVVTVNKASTTALVSSSVNPSQPGQAVTFTAAVTVQAPGSAVVTGQVQFLDGAALLGTAPVSGGTASITASALTVGAHSITASYSGDGNVNSSVSAALTQTVSTPAKSASTVVATVSSSTAVVGQPLTITATVSGTSASGAQPTGTVQLLDGGNGTVTASLNGVSAQFTVSTLTAGAHSLTVTYSGDTNFNGSTSSPVTVTISKATGVLQLSSSVNPSQQGQNVVFTAAFNVQSAAGQVQLLDGATQLGAAPLSNGTASFSTSGLTIGAHNITASYGGDGNVNPAVSAVVVQTVVAPAKSASTVAATVSSGTAVVGQPLTITATVSGTSPSGAPPTGTVQLMDGATVAATSVLNGGSAQFAISTLTVGAHSLSLAYSGDNNFNGSTSSPVTVTINKATGVLQLSSSLNPSQQGQAVTFTATLSVQSATGQVQFLDGATALGAAALNGGTASVSTSSLSAGTHNVTASYSGDINISPALSAVFTQSVTPATLSVAILAVTNGASFLAGPVSPGEIVTIFGTGMGPAILAGARLTAAGTLDTSIAGTTVLFDGVPAPMIYSSARQVAAVVPYSVGGNTVTQMQAAYQGVTSSATPVPVEGSSPAVFTADASGQGPGAIQNQDMSYNSTANPATAGSIIVLYGTGEGLTDPAGADGKIANDVLPKPILPLSVQIGGVDAALDYFGAAPGGVAGEIQINVKVPQGLPPGPATVAVKIGDKTSQPGVTVALK